MAARAFALYAGAAAVGAALIATSHFWLGVLLMTPLLCWLVAFLSVAVFMLIVLRGFSTRRDDGTLSDEK